MKIVSKYRDVAGNAMKAKQSKSKAKAKQHKKQSNILQGTFSWQWASSSLETGRRQCAVTVTASASGLDSDTSVHAALAGNFRLNHAATRNLRYSSFRARPTRSRLASSPASFHSAFFFHRHQPRTNVTYFVRLEVLIPSLLKV